jgi:DNA-binding transcriptional MocR family regulator
MRLDQVRAKYKVLQSAGLKLDLTRGKPSPDQLNLSNALLALPGDGRFNAADGTDVRNYGGLQGLTEARALFTGLVGVPVGQIVLGNNASLALMHDTIVFALLKGMCDSEKPWGDEEISFLCPVPGYDRHFAICEAHGIKMIPVTLLDDGPNMDAVEKLVANDASIKGMWCVPKYSNPTGAVYSDENVERLAVMKAAAKDFRIFWDNAYGVHHLTEESIGLANLMELCEAKGNANRAFVFASSSKITLAGAGISAVGSSKENVSWLLKQMLPQTIGSDKVNQLRHVMFLKDAAGINALMAKHRALLAPKFEAVLKVFAAELTKLKDVSWTTPKGGYFISLEVPKGCAKSVVLLAKEAGVVLTPAGSTHPLGVDPDDRVIRIAPSFPSLADVEQAAKVVAVCVQVAAEEMV